MDNKDLPPYSSGYTSNKSIGHNDWKLFRKTRLEATKEYYHYINIKLCEEGEIKLILKIIRTFLFC